MKKEKIIFICFVLFLLLLSMVFIYKFEISENGYYKTELVDESTDKTVTQNKDKYIDSIEIGKDIKYIDIFFNTKDVGYADGKYHLKVFTKNSKIYEDVIIHKILSGGKYRIKLKNIEKTDKINIKLIYSGKKTTFSPLINNGHIVNQQFYKKNKVYLAVYGFLFVINAMMIIMYKIIMSNKQRKIEIKFLLLAIPIFFAFMILNPMFLGHDERFHFFRIYEITEGGILPEIQGKETGYHMPSAVYTNIGWGERKYSEIFSVIKDKIDKNNVSFISDVTMSVYSPIQYTPQIIGVSFAKIITSRPVLIAYIGRFFNLLFCITFLFFAIKITPYGKNLFLLFSFVPISIEAFTSLSGDGVTISVSYLFMAYIFSMMARKSYKLKKRDFPILISLGMILSFCKLVYIPLIGLLLLIPKNYFNGIKKKICFIIPIMLLLISFNLIWLKIAGKYLDVYTGGTSNYQIRFIINNLVAYFAMFINTFFTMFITYVREAFGETLLWGNAIQNYSIFGVLLFITAIVVCVNDESLKKKFDTYGCFIITIIFTMIIGLIFTSLFVQWTSYGSTLIDGVQGRYFSPFLPLIFILVGNFISKKKKIKQENITKLVLIVSIVVNYASIIEMFIKFI